MRNEPDVLEVRRKIIETAKAIISGNLLFIEGARLIERLHWTAGLPDHDPDFIPFIGISCRTDALPLGDERKHWAPEALIRLQPDIDRAEEWAWEYGQGACEKLINRFAGGTG